MQVFSSYSRYATAEWSVELCKDSEYRVDQTENTGSPKHTAKARQRRYLMLQRTHYFDVQFLKTVISGAVSCFGMFRQQYRTG